MSETIEKISHSANLLVCLGGLATATTVIAGAGAIVSGVLSWRELTRRLPPAAKPLAEEISTNLQARLSAPNVNEDQRILIPDMIAASLPDPDQIIAHNLQAPALVAEMEKMLRDPEHRLPDNIHLFRAVLTPILADLLNNATFTNSLAPAYQRAVLDRLQEIAESLATLSASYGTLAKSLDDLRNLKRRELETLALRFGLDIPPDAGDAFILGELEKAAEDFKARRLRTENLPDLTPQIAALKEKARAANENLDFALVDDFLLQAQQIEQEIAEEALKRVEAARETALQALDAVALTQVERAENALNQGHADQAFTILTAAADSFASLDPVEPAGRRLDYAEILRQHGMRYGGPGLPLAAQMNRDALDRLDRTTHPPLWAGAQNNLANALQTQGERSDGAKGNSLLAEAVTAYRAALEVTTRKDHPLDWAMTQQNLAGALETQGSRTDGAKGNSLLAQAVTAYRAALEVITRKDHPLNWATTQQNLAIALETQGSRTDGAKGNSLLAEAVAAYRAALEVRTRKDHPLNWATTQQNLAIALETQGSRTDEAKGNSLLAEAVTAYRAALEVRTRKDHPLQWAMTQQNLAIALETQGSRTDGAKGNSLLGEAVTTYCAALEVFTRTDHPLHWAMTRENLAIAEVAWAQHPTCIEPEPHLRAALEHVDAALQIYDPDTLPFYFNTATRLRADIRAALGLPHDTPPPDPT